MDEAEGATLDAACTWGKRTDGWAGQALAPATAARSARPGAARQGFVVCGGVFVGGVFVCRGVGVGDIAQASDMATDGGNPQRSSRALTRHCLAAARTNIGEYK
jgi:hypothetical protein